MARPQDTPSDTDVEAQTDARWGAPDTLREQADDGPETLREDPATLDELRETWPRGGPATDPAIAVIDPADPEGFRRLERLHAEAGRWEELAEACIARAGATDDPAERVSILKKLAAINEEWLEDPEEAYEALKLAWTEDFNDRGLVEELGRLADELGTWEDLFAAAQKELGRADEAATAAICRTCAWWLGDRVQRPGDAIPYVEHALRLEPTDADTLEQLAVLQRATHRWGDLADTLERLLHVATDVTRRADLHVALGELCGSHLACPDEAPSHYERAVEEDPRHLDALEALESVHFERGEWSEMLEVFWRRLAAVEAAGGAGAVVEDTGSGTFRRSSEGRAPEELSLRESPGGTRAQAREQMLADLERRLQEVRDPVARARAYDAVGREWRERGDALRAIDAHRKAVALDGENVDSLEALVRLHERRDDVASALEVMEQLATAVDEPERELALRVRMARLLGERGDAEGARAHYERVLALDPAHRPSLEAMRGILAEADDWVGVAKVLETDIAAGGDELHISRLWVELARVREAHLYDPNGALEAHAEALRCNRYNDEAALVVAEEHVRAERWEQACPLLRGLVARANDRAPEELHRLAVTWGEAATRIGEDAEAVRAFEEATRLDPTHLPSARGLAEACARAGLWDRAYELYRRLLVHHRDRLDGASLTDVYHRLGVVERERGAPRRALHVFAEALREDPQHRPSLEACARIHEGQKEWARVVEFETRLVHLVGADERFERLVRLGGIWNDELRDPRRAVEAYTEASSLRPDDHRVLHALLACHQEAGAWADAIQVIDRIDALEDRAPVKAKYAYTMGVILRDELGDDPGAVKRFEQALDQDAKHLKAFEAIDRILTRRKDWKQLERAYRRMLHRVVGQGDAELEFNLWHALGVVYRDRMQRFDEAAQAFEMASRVRPEVTVEHRILAELYERIPDRVDDAIREHQWLLQQDPRRETSLRALYRLYVHTCAYDRAWCLAAALVFLGKADGEERAYFGRYRQRQIAHPRWRMTREDWRESLAHPTENRLLTALFETVAPAVSASKASADATLGLDPRHLESASESALPLGQTFQFLAEVMDLPVVPRLFVRPEAPGGLAPVLGSQPPAVVCGATLLSGFDDQERAFVIARQLAYYRGEHFIRTLLATRAELGTLVVACLHFAGVGSGSPQVAATAQRLASRLSSSQRAAMGRVVARIVESEARADVQEWMRAVELTACRAGLLFANDLETSARMIRYLPPQGPSDLSPRAKTEAMLAFSVSEAYFAVREALGITIG